MSAYFILNSPNKFYRELVIFFLNISSGEVIKRKDDEDDDTDDSGIVSGFTCHATE